MAAIQITQIAADSLRGNPFRAALTMLGVIIGVGAVITMLALGTGAQRAVDEQLAALGANVITVTSGMRFIQGVARNQTNLTIDDAAALRRDGHGFIAVVPEQSGRQQIKFGNRNLNLSVIGTTPDHLAVDNMSIEVGRMFSAADDAGRRRVVVIGAEVAEQLDIAPAQLIGAMLYIKDLSFEVIGVLRKKGGQGFSNPDDDLYIPLLTSRDRITGAEQLQNILVQNEPGIEPAPAMVEIERVLRREHRIPPGQDNDFLIIDRRQFLATQQATTEILGFLLAGIAGVSLLVGGIGIMNIMLVTVTERTREIGVRKALGATRKDILLQFLFESVTLCVAGGVLGILFGTGLAGLLSRFAGWQTVVSFESVLLSFGFSAAVGLIFGLWPAQRAARLDPIEALRHE
ncbi:MAG: ABC transporter permease [Steroidobacteraceae bacterium]